jgi:outer membrane biosynthesis protein TonB
MSGPERNRPPWVMIFILLSLLAHLIFFLTIVLVSRFLPTPELKADKPLTSVSLSLEQPPPSLAPPTPPPPKRLFLPTTPDQQAEHKQAPIESDNDTRMKSKSQVTRTPDSLLPDVDVKQEHPANLQQAPNSPSKQPSQAAQASQGSDQQEKPSPQPPRPSQPQPEPSHPSTSVTKEPAKNPTPHPMTPKPEVALDPNGLPVLPPIEAPTMAPASQRQKEEPAFSTPEVAQSVHGALGTHGDTSPAAMATELGRYKAKVYRAVGSRWYPKVDKQFQLLPAGIVHIQFTIHKDGTVDTKVLEGNEADLQLLLAISLNSIREASPFEPFTDSMIREVGDSYTDDFSFSIYGQ